PPAFAPGLPCPRRYDRCPAHGHRLRERCRLHAGAGRVPLPRGHRADTGRDARAARRRVIRSRLPAAVEPRAAGVRLKTDTTAPALPEPATAFREAFMNTERHLATVLLAALSAAAGTSALAANEALNALEYGHAPATANEARIVVQLHSSGHWQQVQNAHVAWRMRIDGSWNMTYAPDEAHYRIQFRPAGHAHEGNFHTCSDLSTCHDVK